MNTTFSIGLLNPSQENLTVLITSESSENYNTTLPKKVVLEPSPATANPKGANYYYVGNGKYAKVTKVDFEASTNIYRDSNTIEIPVTVEAFQKGATENDVRQIRQHFFTFNIDPSLTPIDPPSKENDSAGLNFSKSEPENNSKGENESERGPGTEKSAINESNSSKTYKSEENQTANGGIDTTTMIYIAGILGSVYYIYRVV